MTRSSYRSSGQGNKMLNQAEIIQFQRDGYLRGRRVLTDDQVDELRLRSSNESLRRGNAQKRSIEIRVWATR